MQQQERGAHEPAGLTTEAVTGEARIHAALAAEHDTLAQDSGGQVNPRYLFVPRAAGQLVCGELVLEPALGPVRVAAAVPRKFEVHGRTAFVQIAWTDDLGPCRAAGRYPVDTEFPVRMPDYADRLVIRRGMDQAARAERAVTGKVARLIAAHVHLGPRSALYGFAGNGAVPEALFDELNLVSTSQPLYRPWASALARFCIDREDTGPVPGWGPARPSTQNDEPQPEAAGGRTPPKARVRPLATRRMPLETAIRLMDAAYALGVAAASRSEVSAAQARWLVRQHDRFSF